MNLAASSPRVIPSRAHREGPRNRRLIIQTSLSDTRLLVRSLAYARDDKLRTKPSDNRAVNI